MTPKHTQTLLITADQQWSSLLSEYLYHQGFTPLIVMPTDQLSLEVSQQLRPELLLLDLHPTDNFALIINLCTEMLRAQPSVKIILITAEDQVVPLVVLHAGIAGCIARTFPLVEWPGVLAYVLNGGVIFSRAIIETLLTQHSPVQKINPWLTIGLLQIDLTQHTVIYAGRSIHLTGREYALLVCLARRVDQVVTFDQLLTEVWGYDNDDGSPAQVRLYVTRLRRKMLEEAQTPDFIYTERTIGYRLESEALFHRPPPPERAVAPGKILARPRGFTWLMRWDLELWPFDAESIQANVMAGGKHSTAIAQDWLEHLLRHPLEEPTPSLCRSVRGSAGVWLQAINPLPYLYELQATVTPVWGELLPYLAFL
jgi:DNA-binding response OmpR family regulator